MEACVSWLIFISKSFGQLVEYNLIGLHNPSLKLFSGKRVLDENFVPVGFVQVERRTDGTVALPQIHTLLGRQLDAYALVGLLQRQMQEYFPLNPEHNHVRPVRRILSHPRQAQTKLPHLLNIHNYSLI